MKQSRSRNQGEHAPTHGVSWKIVAALFVLAALISGGAITYGLLLIDWKKQAHPSPRLLEQPYPRDETEALRLARRSWEQFVETPGWEERVQWVRDAERVRPMMQDYYVKQSRPLPTMSRMSAGSQVAYDHRQLVLFEVDPFSGPRYPVAMEWENGRFVVDWESLTAYGTMSWIELLESRPQDVQTMRVYLSLLKDSLAPPPITGWAFLGMEHRDAPDAEILAIRISDAAALKPQIRSKRQPATIEIRWNPEIQRFEMVRLLATNWSL